MVLMKLLLMMVLYPRLCTSMSCDLRGRGMVLVVLVVLVSLDRSLRKPIWSANRSIVVQFVTVALVVRVTSKVPIKRQSCF